MPLQTFFNLPTKKRNRITEAALDEFATNDYNSASINNIIDRADISKGSIYQYFKNKKDLYLYLIDLASESKLGTITEAVSNYTNLDFYELLKTMHLEGLKYDLSHPKYNRLLFNATNEINNDELENLSSDILKRSDHYFIDFIIEAQKKGEIRQDIDVDFISFIISRVSISMSDYVSSRFDFSYEDTIKEGRGNLPVPEAELEEILDDMIIILKEGLKK